MTLISVWLKRVRLTRRRTAAAPWLAVPAVPELHDPAVRGGAGDEVESVGPWVTVEQASALARNVGKHAHLKLVDQVEPHERPPKANAAPHHDVTIAALPQRVHLFGCVTSGDRGVGPIGGLQRS